MPDLSQGLSFSICNMGEQTSPSGLSPAGLSLHILTQSQTCRGTPGDLHSPGPPGTLSMGPFVGGRLPRDLGRRASFRMILGSLSPPDLTPSPVVEGQPQASKCCSALGPQGGRGTQAQHLPLLQRAGSGTTGTRLSVLVCRGDQALGRGRPLPCSLDGPRASAPASSGKLFKTQPDPLRPNSG